MNRSRSMLIGAAWLALFVLACAWFVWCGLLLVGLTFSLGDAAPGSTSASDWLVVAGAALGTYVAAPIVFMLVAVGLWQNRPPNGGELIRVLWTYARGVAAVVALAAAALLLAYCTAQ